MTYSPTVRRKRLSNALSQLRRDAGFTMAQLADQLDWRESKVSRIESNDWKRPTIRDVVDFATLCGVTDEEQLAALVTLARQSRESGWWEEFKDILPGATLPGFEAESSRILSYQGLLIPGLLQTPDYMRAVFAAGQLLDETIVQRRIDLRVGRQRLLDGENAPDLWVVLDEAALRKHVGGPKVMREQLAHIMKMAERPSIAVQVLPDAVGAHPAMDGAFVILEYARTGDPTLVYLETAGRGDLYLESPEDVGRYIVRYDHVRASALSPDASAAYLADLVEQLK